WIAEAQHVENSTKPKDFLVSEESKMDSLQLDKVLIENLREYLQKLEEKINKLRILAAEIRQPQEAAKGVEEEYLSNPLHSFPLIRHMHQDWKYLEEFMRSPVGEEQIHFLQEKLPELPLKSDGDKATEAMYRMARTYNATPWDMAHGLIDGIQFRNTLTALDCFEIGKLYFKWGFFEEASQWFNVTSNFDQNSKTNEAMGLHRRDLALLQARSLVELGMIYTIIRYKIFRALYIYIDQDDEARIVLTNQPDLAENYTSLLDLFKAHWHDPPEDIAYLPEDYSRLCQSSHVPILSRLHCRYNSTTSPFLILAPLKMEEISLDPYIIVYHDIFSLKKTKKIIRFGDPIMEPTYIYATGNESVTNSERTALGAWVHEEDVNAADSPFHNLKDVLRDITGLNIGEIEIQLLKYGFGAHYRPHVDFFDMEVKDYNTDGDRIATVIFYLNDAPHGGATAFTDLNIKVPAERGKVLFWYNIEGETLDLDWDTTHAACPVFLGFKY
ncbi:hypothetical protein KR054_006995, partial [Drosophila jambulina]